MKTSIYSAAFFAALAAAAPHSHFEKRQDDGTDSGVSDEQILNYALTLEHLEAAFYTQGLQQYNAKAFEKVNIKGKNFYKNFKKVMRDEVSHVAVIESIMASANMTSTKPCTYDFGLTGPRDFIAKAGLLEGVGVSAYLGAAALISDKTYLTAAGSILTVEARHNAFIRNLRTQSPFPASYDTPLDFNQVYTLAAGFIKECPSDNPDLGVSAFPALTVSGKNMNFKNKEITFTVPSDFTFPDGSVYVAWPAVTGPIIVEATADSDAKTVTCTIPSSGGAVGPLGQSYAVLTTSATELTDAVTIAGPAFVNVASPYLEGNGSA
ncbi:ferritin-like domain-containing protein 2 [Elsinoe australis]|uniref:Ferritin-like domain-containing protein 2 n=1 Tax=Elsinoe australis TaxID=40998 RepID=A0A2P7YCD8_9PEZI|nr:Protein rds1 [Elsinoe australis]TKX21349.1 ferritin-like domain-containing protein 2 [Elsinoe australis]